MSARAQTCNFTLTVRYAETDAQGVVHHANYLTWFEEGRAEYLRQKGLCYSDLEKDGYFVVVARATIDYRAPAYFEDRIAIATTLERSGGRLLEFSYQAINQHGILVAEGATRHLVLDRKRRLVSIPKSLRHLLE